MKLFVLRSHVANEGDDIFGVFSTEAKAIKAKESGEKEYPLRDWYYDEFDLDQDTITGKQID